MSELATSAEEVDIHTLPAISLLSREGEEERPSLNDWGSSECFFLTKRGDSIFWLLVQERISSYCSGSGMVYGKFACRIKEEFRFPEVCLPSPYSFVDEEESPASNYLDIALKLDSDTPLDVIKLFCKYGVATSSLMDFDLSTLSDEIQDKIFYIKTGQYEVPCIFARKRVSFVSNTNRITEEIDMTFLVALIDDIKTIQELSDYVVTYLGKLCCTRVINSVYEQIYHSIYKGNFEIEDKYALKKKVAIHIKELLITPNRIRAGDSTKQLIHKRLLGLLVAHDLLNEHFRSGILEDVLDGSVVRELKRAHIKLYKYGLVLKAVKSSLEEPYAFKNLSSIQSFKTSIRTLAIKNDDLEEYLQDTQKNTISKLIDIANQLEESIASYKKSQIDLLNSDCYLSRVKKVESILCKKNIRLTEIQGNLLGNKELNDKLADIHLLDEDELLQLTLDFFHWSKTMQRAIFNIFYVYKAPIEVKVVDVDRKYLKSVQCGPFEVYLMLNPNDSVYDRDTSNINLIASTEQFLFAMIDSECVKIHPHTRLHQITDLPSLLALETSHPICLGETEPALLKCYKDRTLINAVLLTHHCLTHAYSNDQWGQGYKYFPKY